MAASSSHLFALPSSRLHTPSPFHLASPNRIRVRVLAKSCPDNQSFDSNDSDSSSAPTTKAQVNNITSVSSFYFQIEKILIFHANSGLWLSRLNGQFTNLYQLQKFPIDRFDSVIV